MAPIDPARIRSQLTAIRRIRRPVEKGRRLEDLINHIFSAVPGLTVEAQDVVNAYNTEEIDLYFWNERDPSGLHFLDCPLIVECKGWSGPVRGAEVRYFATTLKDKGRRDGIFVALEGITGNPRNLTAGFYHVAAALAEGQLVLVLTRDDLTSLTSAADLVALLKRRMLEQVKGQILALEDRPASRRGSNQRASSRRRSSSRRRGR